MKKLLFLLVFVVTLVPATFSQVFDSLTVIHPDYDIEDIAWKGDLLFAALGEGGVMYSSDEGYSWTATSELPDAGFGQEAANSIFAASNGDLIVGGNLNYNGSPLSGVVFRSSDNGTTWSFVAVEGIGGYEKSDKIIELPGGNLMMKAGQVKLFVSSLSDPAWSQITAPGGVIFGFERIGDMVFTVTNPSAGSAGTWVSSDMGQNWQKYGGNGTPVSGGTVTLAPIINTSDYKFICIGGAYDLKGVFRAGINDTLWEEKINGIDNFGVYPISMATDNHTIWMIFQDAGGGCYFTSTEDFAENWETPVMGLPQEGGSNPCPEKLMVFKSHLYTFSNNSIFRQENVAIPPSSVNEKNYVTKNIDLFPNPVSNQLNIKYKDNKQLDGNWEIINIYGQTVMSGQFMTNINNYATIKVNRLLPGFYLLKTDSNSIVSVANFIKK